MNTILQIAGIILAVLIVIFQKLKDLRYNKEENFWHDIRPEGKKLLLASIVLVILQIISLFCFESLSDKVENANLLSESNLKTSKELIESSRPNLIIHKDKCDWIKNSEGENNIRICLINMGCRSGSIVTAKLDIVELEEGFKKYVYGTVLNPEKEWKGLINKKLDTEKCCIALKQKQFYKEKYDSSVLQLIIQLDGKYIDDNTKDTFEIIEQYYYDGSGNNFKKGIPERLMNEIKNSTDSIPAKMKLKF